MPIGVICNVLSVAVGGLLGAALGNRLDDNMKKQFNMIFGLCSMSMGITSVILMVNMPAVIFAVIIGTVIGLLCHIGDGVNRAAGGLQKIVNGFGKTNKTGAGRTPEQEAMLLTVIVLFCSSGTGIYGCLVSGMNQDHSILIAKSVLDLFTAMIFACSLGAVVSAVAIPQCLIFLALYFLAGFIYPLTTADMINDFKACGGMIMVATGFRMLGLTMFPIADMIPAMILVMPLSYLWSTYILPLI